ncbi:MAG: glycosyltransferase [Longimicrobiales bacterium]
MNISFIVCCHNSALRLSATLVHLAAVEAMPGVDWEVVVVDNTSTDNTAKVARRCWSDAGAPAPLRVVQEPTPGLVHARRCGVRAARHEIVCFVDDDNWIRPSWPRVLNEIFTTCPAVGAAGGLGRPVFDGPEPGWFRSVQWAYAVGPQAPRSGEVPRARGYLYGAGLALRRDAFLDVEKKGFRPLLTGRKGGELLAGEDSELCFQLALAGWQLWYDRRLVFDHFIPAFRVTPGHAARLIEGLGYASAYLDAYVLAGAAARPLHWTWLNGLFLPRFLIAGAQYIKSCLVAIASGKDGDLMRYLFRGRLKGVVNGRHRNRVLRRTLSEMASCQRSAREGMAFPPLRDEVPLSPGRGAGKTRRHKGGP